jgi:hypothetical protein
MMTAIKPDQQLLLAMTKATTGANAHDVGEFMSRYHYACEKGLAENANLWEQVFSAFLSGRITPLRKAVAQIRFAGKPPMYGNKEWWQQGE